MFNASWYLESKQEQTTQTFFLRTLPMTRIYSNFARLFRMPYPNDSLHKKNVLHGFRPCRHKSDVAETIDLALGCLRGGIQPDFHKRSLHLSVGSGQA